MLDVRGSQVEDAGESYWHSATGGVFPPPDLLLGERFLVDVGLVDERENRLFPTERLSALLGGGIEDALAILLSDSLLFSPPPSTGQSDKGLELSFASVIPDAGRREQLLLALGRRFDDSHRRQVGAVGEQLVVSRLRAELDELGYSDLARDVRQVSLLSDQLGYDVVAPRIAGPRRLLEVKSTEADVASPVIKVHVSRNEIDTGLRYRDWALVIVHVTNLLSEEGEVVGWCDAAALDALLPSDSAEGRWEQAVLSIPASRLMEGLPAAVV